MELDDRGVTILDQAMRGEMAPLGVVYGLDYLALRPAYHVKLKIDWDRVQDIMDTTYGHEGLFTSIQIQDTVEKLEDERAIVFEADTFVPEDEGGSITERRDAAVARVRDMITDAFFESSIDPLRQAPDGWDKAAGIIKSFAPQRFAPMGVFSYKKTHYSRIDSKRLDVDFSERITLKRSIYPQGHLSGLFRALGAGLDISRLVIAVNADDPWFKRRKVRVISRADFVNDPVRSMTATLTYGGVTQDGAARQAKQEESVEWPSTVKDGAMIEPVSMHFAVDLKPADAGERPNTLVSGDTQILGEAEEIEPRDLFSLEAIPVLTLPNFPFDRYPQIDVQLRYDDPAHGIRQDDLVRITKEQPNGQWQRFLVGAPAGPIMAKLTYRAADHRDRDFPFVPLTRPQVDIADPFPQRLKVTVVPALNFNEVDRAFVDLQYDDAQNAVHVEDSIEIAQNQPIRPFVVERVDPMLARVRYKVTILMKDGTLFEGPWSTTLASRVFVRPDLKGHRAVTLKAPADFVAEGLEKITDRGADEGRDRRPLVRGPLRLHQRRGDGDLRVRLRRSRQRRLRAQDPLDVQERPVGQPGLAALRSRRGHDSRPHLGPMEADHAAARLYDVRSGRRDGLCRSRRPEPVLLSSRRALSSTSGPDGSDAFSLLKWKPAAVEAGVKGGGFLMFQTVVTLPPATRSKILGRIASIAPSGEAKLAAAPIELGHGALPRPQSRGQRRHDRHATTAWRLQRRHQDPRRHQAVALGERDRGVLAGTRPGRGDDPRKGVRERHHAGRRDLRAGVLGAHARSAREDHRRLRADLQPLFRQRRSADLLGEGRHRRRLREAGAGRRDQDRGHRLRRRSRQGSQGKVGARLLQAGPAAEVVRTIPRSRTDERPGAGRRARQRARAAEEAAAREASTTPEKEARARRRPSRDASRGDQAADAKPPDQGGGTPQPPRRPPR